MNKKIDRGTISIVDHKGKKQKVDFDFTPNHDHNIGDTLMNHFKDCHFSPDEKQLLTREHRKIILTFKNLPVEKVTEYRDKLILKINRSHSNKIQIQTKNIGTFICLAAILSGKLDTDKNISFQFNMVPILYFPKKLARAKKNIEFKNLKIQFYFEEDSWIKPFKTLYKCPKFLEDKTDFLNFDLAA